MRDICIVFVCNKGYIQKFLNTYKMLKNNGKYQGDVCLIIGNDLRNNDLINEENSSKFFRCFVLSNPLLFIYISLTLKEVNFNQ